MLKFSYKQTIRERVEAKCARHPRYNPEKDGRSSIKGGCSTCFELYEIYASRLKLEAAVKEFTRRAGPWARQREKRRAKKAVPQEEIDFLLAYK